MPPCSVCGLSQARMTSVFQFGASLTFSHIDWPVTVSASLSSRPCSPSARITAGSPPA